MHRHVVRQVLYVLLAALTSDVLSSDPLTGQAPNPNRAGMTAAAAQPWYPPYSSLYAAGQWGYSPVPPWLRRPYHRNPALWRPAAPHSSDRLMESRRMPGGDSRFNSPSTSPGRIVFKQALNDALDEISNGSVMLTNYENITDELTDITEDHDGADGEKKSSFISNLLGGQGASGIPIDSMIQKASAFTFLFGGPKKIFYDTLHKARITRATGEKFMTELNKTTSLAANLDQHKYKGMGLLRTLAKLYDAFGKPVSQFLTAFEAMKIILTVFN